jgi:hypothetical protein
MSNPPSALDAPADLAGRGRARGPRRGKKVALIAAALGLLFLAGEAFFWLPLPCVVRSYAKIVPVREWVLSKGQDGQLIASTFDHQSGLSDGYRLSNFDRGSSIAFTLRSSVLPGRTIAKGDTIGSIYSSDMQERLIGLQGQLAAAEGQLAVSSSGEKAAIVNEAEQRLLFAQRRQLEHRKVLERTTRLWKADLISQGEYERVESEANLMNDEIKIAQANLEAARTGAKPEQLGLVHARIAALKNEIATIQRREATYTLTAPISGTIARSFSADTLVTIVDTSNYVALVPIRWSDYGRLRDQPEPTLTAWGLSAAVHGRITDLNSKMETLHGERVVMASGLLHDASSSLLPGMVARCAIRCPSSTAFQRARHFLAGHDLRSTVAGSLP